MKKIFLIFVLVLILLTTTFYFRQNKKKKVNIEIKEIKEVVETEEIIRQEKEIELPDKPDFLVGGVAKFNYTDSNGNEIGNQFLEWEIIDETDVFLQNNYNEASFSEKIDFDSTVRVTNFRKVKEDYPELYEFLSSTQIYNEEEKEEYISQMNKIINKTEYILFVHPKTKYLFVKAKFTNNSPQNIDLILSDVVVVSAQEPYSNSNVIRPIYCDALKFNDEKEKIWTYELDKGESIECVMGYKLFSTLDWIDIDNEHFYIGYLDDEANPYSYNGGESMASRNYGMYVMVNVMDLNKKIN